MHGWISVDTQAPLLLDSPVSQAGVLHSLDIGSYDGDFGPAASLVHGIFPSDLEGRGDQKVFMMCLDMLRKTLISTSGQHPVMAYCNPEGWCWETDGHTDFHLSWIIRAPWGSFPCLPGGSLQDVEGLGTGTMWWTPFPITHKRGHLASCIDAIANRLNIKGYVCKCVGSWHCWWHFLLFPH